MKDYVAEAKKIIENTIYCTIATATPQGIPWISPVFFAYDNDYSLYWVSNKDARHSRLIGENPSVAIVIFDSSAPEGKGDAVYLEAAATALEDPVDIEKGMQLFNARATQEQFRITSIEECQGDAPWRMYRAIPTQISKLGEGQTIRGQYVDQRIEIIL